LCVVTVPAVRAHTARDRGRDHYAISDLKIANHRAKRFDDADAFVTEDRSRHDSRERAAYEMQVCTANCRGGDADDGVGGLLDLRLRHLFKADIPDPVEDDCFHDCGSCPARDLHTHVDVLCGQEESNTRSGCAAPATAVAGGTLL